MLRTANTADWIRPREGAPLVVLLPILDDWEVAELLLTDLGAHLQRAGLVARVLLVDDGSTDPCPESLGANLPPSIQTIDVLTLRRNLGHQRAIAVGLAYVEEEMPNRAVVIMDGDGQDAPEDVLRLIQRMEETGQDRILFAARMRRSEGVLFRASYWIYRGLHRLLTGVPVRVGNFSIVPRQLLGRLAVERHLWRHYAAAIHEAGIPRDWLPCKRAPRLRGSSKMSYAALVAHGLRAMAVFGRRITRRVWAFSTGAELLVGALLLTHLLVGGSLPAWLVDGAVIVGVLLLPCLLGSGLVALMFLVGGDGSGFLPNRDYRHFVDGIHPLSRASGVDGAGQARGWRFLDGGGEVPTRAAPSTSTR